MQDQVKPRHVIPYALTNLTPSGKRNTNWLIFHFSSCFIRAVLPQYDPIINGLQHNYALGDFVVANCSSDMSSPPARLYWFINDRIVPSDYLQPQQETTIESDGFILRYRTLELRFHIDEARLGKIKGKLMLKCLARIDAFPQGTRETTQVVYIPMTDELRNQKLINWRNGAGMKYLGEHFRQKVKL
ncbi:AAEL009729-PA [Aedes aegypti]|uniref:AAEL009729-PA n=1 Tax=Aedes aegypti TaxID=7159 RepID=Q16V10_AEDAE|nr:AAEL009729-PA [Aedes aegypti]